jgi:aminomethyltransferase
MLCAFENVAKLKFSGLSPIKRRIKNIAMNQLSKNTYLHGWHTVHRASMAPFGGYDMPLWYASAKNEHLAVLTAAGLFDTSHMAAVAIKGPGSFELLQRCFTNDLSACVGSQKNPLSPGRCVYGALLTNQGTVVDDTIIYQLEEYDYLSVVNAGMGARVAQHLTIYKGSREVEIIDLTDSIGKIDLQGPMSGQILKKVLLHPEAVLEEMPYFSFKGHYQSNPSSADPVLLTDSTPILLSRTGYTGEFGFEIFVDPLHLVKVWEMLLESGEEFGVIPCGLAARDSLRTGAMLPLSHQDIGAWPFINHPWHFALPFNSDETHFTKEFIGAKSLLNISQPEYTYPVVGDNVCKVSSPGNSVVLDSEENPIGSVLTCVTDMGIGRHHDKIYSIASPGKPTDFTPHGLCCGFVKVNKVLETGQTLFLQDDRRTIRVRVVKDIRPDRTARRPINEMV